MPDGLDRSQLLDFRVEAFPHSDLPDLDLDPIGEDGVTARMRSAHPHLRPGGDARLAAHATVTYAIPRDPS